MRTWYDFVAPSASQQSTLTSAWMNLIDCDEYLLVADGLGEIRQLGSNPNERALFPSQFCRKRIAQHFSIKKPWDWRQYQFKEPLLLETLHFFFNNPNLYHTKSASRTTPRRIE